MNEILESSPVYSSHSIEHLESLDSLEVLTNKATKRSLPEDIRFSSDSSGFSLGSKRVKTSNMGRSSKGKSDNESKILHKVYKDWNLDNWFTKGCLQKIKKVNFGTSAQKGGGGTGKIPNSYQ